ncbi:diguanylate cyclase [Acidicapsa dinghuensis]|uniref:diguanylate cyclase n=1 Tax=Acidicapsa dinghuensis TaxID=2218256 RepID=A0ABW1EKY0_9BACT|nr:diguanylate cyclase [Acidicapsa dinghuensis]
MKSRAWPPSRLQHALIVTAAFLILDGWCSRLSWVYSAETGYLFQIAAPITALAAVIWHARTITSRARGLWILLATALVLYSMAVPMLAWDEKVERLAFGAPSLANFALFFYGVPILFALSTPVEGEKLPLFSWLDAGQAFFAGYLTYVVIFASSPFFDTGIQPISKHLLDFTYNVENLALVAGCAVRLLASPKGEEHGFFRTLLLYLAAYSASIAFYNHSMLAAMGRSPWRFLVDASFLLLALLIFALPEPQPAVLRKDATRSRLAIFFDHGSPIFFTIALTALGFVTLEHHFYTGVLAIGAGLAAYGIRTTVLQMRYMHIQQELRTAHDRLEELSLQDSLTGIANRRRFDQTLDSEWHRAMRVHSPLSLLLIDLDFFKNMNDTYGHRHGDRCLTRVAAALQSVASRSGDLIARYGGEEFAAILPVTHMDAARAIALRMKAAIEGLKITNPSEIGNYLSISIGICSCEAPVCGSPEALIESADRALYRAKQYGRNRVEFEAMLDIPHVEREEDETQGALFSMQKTQLGENS